MKAALGLIRNLAFASSVLVTGCVLDSEKPFFEPGEFVDAPHPYFVLVDAEAKQKDSNELPMILLREPGTPAVYSILEVERGDKSRSKSAAKVIQLLQDCANKAKSIVCDQDDIDSAVVQAKKLMTKKSGSCCGFVPISTKYIAFQIAGKLVESFPGRYIVAVGQLASETSVRWFNIDCRDEATLDQFGILYRKKFAADGLGGFRIELTVVGPKDKASTKAYLTKCAEDANAAGRAEMYFLAPIAWF